MNIIPAEVAVVNRIKPEHRLLIEGIIRRCDEDPEYKEIHRRFFMLLQDTSHRNFTMNITSKNLNLRTNIILDLRGLGYTVLRKDKCQLISDDCVLDISF